MNCTLNIKIEIKKLNFIFDHYFYCKKMQNIFIFFYFFCLRSVDNVCQITFNFSLSKYYWSSPTLLHHHRHRYLFMSYHYDCYMIVLVCMCVVIKFWKHMIKIQLNQNSHVSTATWVIPLAQIFWNIKSNWFIIICTSKQLL